MVRVLHKDEKILGQKHISLLHAQTAIYDSDVKLFLKQGIQIPSTWSWLNAFVQFEWFNARIQQLTRSLIFNEKYSTSQSDFYGFEISTGQTKNSLAAGHRTTANFEHCLYYQYWCIIHTPFGCQIFGIKNLVRVYNLHQLLTRSCGGQMHELSLKFSKKMCNTMKNVSNYLNISVCVIFRKKE